MQIKQIKYSLQIKLYSPILIHLKKKSSLFKNLLLVQLFPKLPILYKYPKTFKQTYKKKRNSPHSVFIHLDKLNSPLTIIILITFIYKGCNIKYLSKNKYSSH